MKPQHPALDPGRHIRVDRTPRPRPALTGVSQLLAAQDGETRLAYACAEGKVLVEFSWRLTAAELLEADAAAGPLAVLPGAHVVRALGETFRRDLTYRLASLVEVGPLEVVE